MAYWTKYGGLNMHPEIEAENHPLFRAYHDFWAMLTRTPVEVNEGIRFILLTEFDDGWYQAKIPERGLHFSRDNMWGLYFLRLLYGLKIDYMPVWYWNGEFRWHPNQWAVFLSLKSKFCGRGILNFLLYPLVRGMYLYSQRKYRKNPDYTTGPCLWTLAKYYLWDELPTLEDINAFRYYCTFGYRWDLPDQPILEKIKRY